MFRGRVVKLHGRQRGSPEVGSCSTGVLPCIGGAPGENQVGGQHVECLVPRDSQVEETKRWSDIQAWSSKEASQEFTDEGLNLL